jgi:cytochrome c2
MGATLRKTRLGDALTFSCAACHSANLFGKKILGMTNRTSRANEFIHLGRKATSFSSPKFFQDSTKATDLETLQYERTRENAYSIGSKAPQAIGLDTSLAQVALSLSKRKKDPYASHSWFRATFPRKNALRNKVADSKPAVWWNLKYKTRWLSDGSIVSGNPVHTNFLWNEIGRGTDLKELEAWLQKNHRAVKELTATVFATEAPRYSDFFEVHQEDLESAKKGQKHYRKLCSSCHGVYRKAWELDQPEEFSVAELMNTIEVIYHEKTPVIDVGTDPGRYQGMKAFAERLNKLKISKAIKTRVEPQTGYVPPPLVGIWARWPYFHNNSIPNLCVLLSPAPKRPAHYWSHPANDSERDFDKDCNGYFTGEEVPDSWKKRSRYFDTQKEGLSNRGHDEGIFIEDGKSLLSETEKKELIDYLKTL